MIQKIKKLIVVTMVSLSIMAPGLVPALAGAAFANTITDQVCQGANSAANGTSGGSSCVPSQSGETGIQTVANKAVSIFSLIVGAISIIMIIVGGFRYITSGGSSEKVGGAKNTLIYAIIGLIIVALAQFIVHYVLNTTTNTVNNNAQ